MRAYSNIIRELAIKKYGTMREASKALGFRVSNYTYFKKGISMARARELAAEFEVPVEEIVDMNYAVHYGDRNHRESCNGCAYRSNHAPETCDFMLITGDSRGCPPEKCTRKKARGQLSEQERRQIAVYDRGFSLPEKGKR